MIGKIYGIIDELHSDHLLLKTNSGVCYIIYCSEQILQKFSINEELSLLIQTYIQEDKFELFGFTKQEEKILFNLLNSVKGVSAKIALKILSFDQESQIKNAIFLQNLGFFKQITGIGIKLAERIIYELKNKVYKNIVRNKIQNSLILNQAVEALEKLGMKRDCAIKKTFSIFQENQNISLNELVKLTLSYEKK